MCGTGLACCGAGLGNVFAACLDCFKCGAPKFESRLGIQRPQELWEQLLKTTFRRTSRTSGLSRSRKPFSMIRVLRLPEEVDVEEELLYSQKRYEGERMGGDTHHLVSGLWDEYEMSDDMDLFEDEKKKISSGYRQSLRCALGSTLFDKYFLETALGLIEEIKYKEMNHKDARYVYEGPTWEEAVLEREKTSAEGGCPWFSDIVYYQGADTDSSTRCLVDTAPR